MAYSFVHPHCPNTWSGLCYRLAIVQIAKEHLCRCCSWDLQPRCVCLWVPVEGLLGIRTRCMSNGQINTPKRSIVLCYAASFLGFRFWQPRAIGMTWLLSFVSCCVSFLVCHVPSVTKLAIIVTSVRHCVIVCWLLLHAKEQYVSKSFQMPIVLPAFFPASHQLKTPTKPPIPPNPPHI